jgi:hypothetical protein
MNVTMKTVKQRMEPVTETYWFYYFYRVNKRTEAVIVVESTAI